MNKDKYLYYRSIFNRHHSKRYFKIYSLLISGYYISPTVIKRILLKFFTLLMAV